ncbi:MAG TPA: hypothetical protein ACFYD2_02195 [Candidatus Avalokitesvara rifleensis]|nr:hypothetical protein [Candidatus Brocadiales bacterium]
MRKEVYPVEERVYHNGEPTFPEVLVTGYGCLKEMAASSLTC